MYRKPIVRRRFIPRTRGGFISEPLRLKVRYTAKYIGLAKANEKVS